MGDDCHAVKALEKCKKRGGKLTHAHYLFILQTYQIFKDQWEKIGCKHQLVFSVFSLSRRCEKVIGTEEKSSFSRPTEERNSLVRQLIFLLNIIFSYKAVPHFLDNLDPKWSLKWWITFFIIYIHILGSSACSWPSSQSHPQVSGKHGILEASSELEADIWVLSWSLLITWESGAVTSLFLEVEWILLWECVGCEWPWLLCLISTNIP